MLDDGNKRFYGYKQDGSIWLNDGWAINRLAEEHNMKLMDMNENQLTEEYVKVFGDPNRA